MAEISATYQVQLRLNGAFVGDCREIAQKLRWTRNLTNYAIDSIEFTVNDVLFEKWCKSYGKTIKAMLKPIALECRIVRNGEDVAGGFLATLPSYEPKQASADLHLRFDGFMNLLDGIILAPTTKTTKRASAFVKDWIDIANARSTAAGKGYGFVAQSVQNLANIERTYDNYKTVKEAILEMTDNQEGAGPFEVIFNPDKSYIITNTFGRTITDWQLYYPPRDGGQSVATIRAPEVQGFASKVITLGAGETSSNPDQSTVITAESSEASAVAEFGYFETMTQYSSVSRQTTLNQHNATDLYNATNLCWNPEITLFGRQTPPSPTADFGLWIGDDIYLENTADQTGMTTGWFHIQAIDVSVSATGAETVRPSLERIA